MITYEQIENNYIEDSSGLWVLTFRVSDTQAGIFADSITSAVFDGSGLDDMTSGGTYTGIAALDIVVEITDTATDKFRWSDDGGSTWQGGIKTITGAAQELVDGVTVTFAAALGHTIGDIWTFSVMGTANIFEIEDVKKDIDLKTGKLAEDEMSFSISQAQLQNETYRVENETALSFILAAQDTDVLRYTGLFLHRTGATLDETTLAFAGVILPEQNWEDINVLDSEWAEVLDAVRDWDITCKPFFEDVFDDVLMKATYDEDGNLIDDGIIDRIEQEWDGSAWQDDTTWRDANRADRQAYWYSDASDYVVFRDLINLNKVLKRFTDLTEQIIINDGKGTYTIDFDKAEIDGIFRPTRYERVSNGSFHTWIVSYYDSNGRTIPYTFPSNDSFLIGGGGFLKLGIYEDELGGDVTDEVSPFVSYRNLVTSRGNTHYIKEPKSKAADKMLWSEHSKIKTFTDFLYYIAMNFGMFLQMYFKSPTEIQIKFISREEYGSDGDQVYIKDYVKGSGKITPVEIKEEDIFFGTSWYLSNEGHDWYLWAYNTAPDKRYQASYEYNELKKEGRRLLLTVSPTLCETDVLYLKNHDSSVIIPHNIGRSLALNANLDEPYKFTHEFSQGLHTGIYMKVSPLNAGVEKEPSTDYFTTAGYWTVNSVDYESISKYLNELYSLEKGYYEKELTIECPFLCNFSDVASPSPATDYNWKNLVLGSKFDYNSKTYIVTSITRNFKQKTTSIKLQNNDRFTFSNPATYGDVGLVQETGFKKDSNFFDVKTSNGSLIAFNIVTINEDSTVSDSKSFSSHYRKLYGMVVGSYNDDDKTVQIVKSGGFVYNSDWSIVEGISGATGTPGQKIYLTKDDTIGVAAGNLTTTPILEKTGDPPNVKNLNACIGWFITEDTLLINFDEQWIIE